ncbi:hypothetical protein [Serratia surfactantfaciens]|uniref:Uncharacterized protein n=1 Tax=Serratia surfactantfaciens TaxID=2741499 RepID=A0ABS0M4V3_9GAMM|nr:hypothetical protein [Serratia surfactantfaciens]MBH1921810.1 hypothetical protein [Serratia surfactantfaciens]
MSNFQIYNTDGSLIIDSEYKHTLVAEHKVPKFYPPDLWGDTIFGDLHKLSYLAINELSVGLLYWARLSPGAWCWPGAKYFTAGGVELIATSHNIAMQSGYLDVFSADSELIWTAKSASDMPRVRSIVEVTSAVDKGIQSLPSSFSPWFPINCMPADSFESEISAQNAGILVRWTGMELQLTWLKYRTQTYSERFSGRGYLKFPIATFINR